MPRFGKQCNGCSAEDCVCCEVYLEWKAEQNASLCYEPDEIDDPGFEPDEIDDW